MAEGLNDNEHYDRSNRPNNNVPNYQMQKTNNPQLYKNNNSNQPPNKQNK